jgi:hypothetical protein
MKQIEEGDETLPIINKPKHQKKKERGGRKTRNKMGWTNTEEDKRTT